MQNRSQKGLRSTKSPKRVDKNEQTDKCQTLNPVLYIYVWANDHTKQEITQCTQSSQLNCTKWANDVCACNQVIQQTKCISVGNTTPLP